MRGHCVWVEARAVPLEVRCGQADWAVVAGWQKLLLSLAVALPIPMLAMSGLAVPLPSAVYRAATAFVESTQGFAGVLTEREAEPAAPAPLRSAPVAGRKAGEASSTRPPATRTLPVGARTSGAAQVAVGTTPTVAARRASRLRGGRPTVANVSTAPTSAADADTRPADPGVKTAAPSSPTPSTATEQASRPVEVARVEPVTPPLSPPPAPSPPPPALEPVTKTLEPVTKPLEPVTKPVTDALDPITEPVLKTGRLLSP
jgi:hypothetical protein